MNKYQTQDERKNAGWRIAMIPYGDRFKLMLMPQSGNVLFDLMPPLGALAFIGGFFSSRLIKPSQRPALT